MERVRDVASGLERLMTPKQKMIFLCVDEFWKKFGYGPSIDDIMMLTGDRGRGNVNRVLKKLCVLGVCKRIPNTARSVRPVYINFRKIE
jgi:SOS-response transcriptional repressor LexA